MSSSSVFHHLYSGTMDPLHLTKQAHAEAQSSWLCTGCCNPRHGIREIDVQVENEKVDSSALNAVFGCGVPVAYKEYLFRFGEDIVRREFYLGDVYGPDGVLIEDLVTFRGRVSLTIRGHKNVSHRVCKKCGRHVYFAMIGGRYLYPQPPTDSQMFESNLSGLVVPDGLFNTGESRDWPGTQYERLMIPKEPRDHLTDLESIEWRASDPC